MMRRVLPLRALQAFEAAARHLSFVRAAEELHVTPAAVSQQIKLLEDHVGQPLFLRGTTLALTLAGKTALAPLKQAFELLEQASAQLRQAQHNRPLVISMPPSFAARWLIPRLERFQDLHPDIELRLSASTRQVNFDTEDVDVAVRYGKGHYPGLHVERLRTENMLAVASPRLAEKLQSVESLAESVLLHNSSMHWDPNAPTWPNWFRSLGVEPAAPLRIREFDDINLVIEAAVAGLGAALVWRSLVEDELASKRLLTMFSEQPVGNAYYFVCPAARLESPNVNAFREWLREEIKAPSGE
jgi:LysR family glycine cleavage system transcriptional activator